MSYKTRSLNDDDVKQHDSNEVGRDLLDPFKTK